MKGVRVFCGDKSTYDYVVPLTAKLSAIKKQFLDKHPEHTVDRIEIMPVGDVRWRAVA